MALDPTRPSLRLLSIQGSPSARSRSAWLQQLAQTRLEGRVAEARTLVLRELPPAALLHADRQASAVSEAVAAVARAQLVIVATPIYKAAYSGLLKTFLDLLPEGALRGKTVLPLATGGTLAHLLALDYALKPVLGALGARDILDGVFATDAQLPKHEDSGGYVPAPELLQRLDSALQPLLESVPRAAHTRVLQV
jgi:FMN reductase